MSFLIINNLRIHKSKEKANNAMNELMVFIGHNIQNWKAANFCCLEKLPRCVYIYICILFLLLSSIMVYSKRLGRVPCLYSRTSLLIHSKCHSLHLVTPNSQSIPLLPSLLATTSLFSTSMSLFLFCR